MVKKKSKASRGNQPPRGAPSNAPAAVQQAATVATQPSDDKPELSRLLTELEQVRGNRVIAYWLTDQAKISDNVVTQLYDHLDVIGRQKKLDMVLFTRGGDVEAPWRIVSLVREFCDEFGVLIPYRAHSGGTLLALGADEIVMTALGELGPIDPTRTHPLLPQREGRPEPEPISVQDLRHAVQFVKETARPEGDDSYTSEAMAQIVTALFTHIHPLAIGAIEQSYALSKLIATRCLGTHMRGSEDPDKIQAIVDHMCDDYKSHRYAINRREAKALGLKVADPPAEVERVLIDLMKFYMGRDRGAPTRRPSVGQKLTLTIGWLDSIDLQFRVEQEFQVEQGDKLRAVASEWKAY